MLSKQPIDAYELDNAVKFTDCKCMEHYFLVFDSAILKMYSE